MRRFIIAGNWKLNNNITEAIELANGLKRELYSIESLDIVLCPVYTALYSVHEVIADSNIGLGAQDTYWQEQGAFTGEVAPLMLKDAGCKYVIIGHSERRQYFSETNEMVNKRIKAALNAGLSPIVCIGETLAQREQNETLEVIKMQLQEGLKDLTPEQVEELVLAYEPVWAIGTGKNATPAQAEEVHKYIRKLLEQLYGAAIAAALRIQYGGSAKPENIEQLIQQPNIDGVLVGGASLKVDPFSQMVKKCAAEAAQVK